MLAETNRNLIDKEQPIEWNYIMLLKRARDAERSDAAGATLCRHCGHRMESHLSDGRCSVDALSQKFCPQDVLERDRVRRAISMIEHLIDI